jgi:Flp pilus assembly protein TadG
MHNSIGSHFLRDESGAVAATYAMALTALIVVAGVGFDYGRLATMDSELQNGADQAALAGATQLDGKDGACARAATAAVSLVTNTTIVANSANTITVADEAGCDATGTVRFWQNRDGTTAATSDANARFIELTVAARTVDYAFTPIVNLMQGSVVAGAMAGLGSSICKVPPVFMCNPDQANDPNFTVSNYVGKGIRLIANDGGGNYGAGNFGFLQTTGGGGNGPDALRGALGKLDQPGDCLAEDGVTTKAGQNASALDALNTRFDIYTGNTNVVCGANGAGCPASANSRKDVVHKGNVNQCSFGGGNGWQLSANPYIPTSATVPLTNAQADVLSPMGYPRDMCHAIDTTGSCSSGIIGDGIWDRNAYFRSHRDFGYALGFDISATFGTSTPTRYQVYKYEAANAATRLIDNNGARVGPALTARPKAYCTSPGVPVGTTAIDRRVIPMAVINCGSGINGASGPHDPIAWVDVFLPEPSVRRRVGSTTYTEASDVYIEVIGATSLGGGGSTAAQLIRRDVPYLVR